MMTDILLYVLFFFFYSAAGWVVESMYCSVGEKKFVNRGFLTGPMCPIYGTGALVMTVFLYNPFYDRPFLVFLLGMILCDLVEYVTSVLMQVLFHARWWDYTYEFLNIKGRICLKHTLYWGIASIVFVYVVHPKIDAFFSSLSVKTVGIIVGVILAVFVLDVINAVRKALDVRQLIIKLNAFSELLSSKINAVKASISDSVGRQNASQGVAVDQIKQLIELTETKLDRSKKKLSNRLVFSGMNLEKTIKKKLSRLKELLEAYIKSK